MFLTPAKINSWLVTDSFHWIFCEIFILRTESVMQRSVRIFLHNIAIMFDFC